MSHGVNFTEESAERIADAVREIENRPRRSDRRRHRYNSSHFQHMYQMNVRGDGVDMRPGVWYREGYWAATGFPSDHEFDVAALSGVATGTVQAYAVLMSGAGLTGGIMPTSDLAFDSTLWDIEDNTANGVMIIFLDKTLGLPDTHTDSQAQWVYLAQIELVDSVVTVVNQDQGQVGLISDSDPLNLGVTDGSSDAEGITYSIEYLDETSLQLEVFGGSWKQHLNDPVVAFGSVTFSQVNLDTFSGDGIYMTILPSETDESSATQDPNLVVAGLNITLGNPAFADNFDPGPWETNARHNNGLILCAKNGAVDLLGVSLAPLLELEVYNGGPVYNDYIRPDGFDPDIGLVNTTYPRGAGLGINAELLHTGVLEDFKFHERVLTANDIGQFDGDFIGMYYNLQTSTGLTEKKYYRIDSHDADLWGAGVSGKSLSVTTNAGNTFLQLTNFHSAFNSAVNTYDEDDTNFDNAQAQGGSYVLVAKDLTNPNDVLYVNPTLDPGSFPWEPGDVPCSSIDKNLSSGVSPCFLHNELTTTRTTDRRADYGPLDDQDWRYTRILSAWDDEAPGLDTGPALFQSLGYATSYDTTTGTSVGSRQVIDLLNNTFLDVSEAVSGDFDARALVDVDGVTPVLTWSSAEVEINTVLLDVNCSGAANITAGASSLFSVHGNLNITTTEFDLILTADRDIILNPTGDLNSTVGGDYDLAITGDHTVDGIITLDVFSVKHGHLSEQIDFVPEHSGGLSGMQAAWDAFHLNLQDLGLEALV